MPTDPEFDQPLRTAAAPARRESGFGLFVLLALVMVLLLMAAPAVWWLRTRAVAKRSPAPTSAVAQPAAPVVPAAPAVIVAHEKRLSLAADPRHAVLQRVSVSGKRGEVRELHFEVTLTRIPLGKTLELRGEWLDPGGRVVHRNQYRTKTIAHDPWKTHIQFKLPGDAAVGPWRVRLSRGQQLLTETTFQVERS